LRTKFVSRLNEGKLGTRAGTEKQAEKNLDAQRRNEEAIKPNFA
jgi:hypothetical protein